MEKEHQENVNKRLWKVVSCWWSLHFALITNFSATAFKAVQDKIYLGLLSLSIYKSLDSQRRRRVNEGGRGKVGLSLDPLAEFALVGDLFASLSLLLLLM